MVKDGEDWHGLQTTKLIFFLRFCLAVYNITLNFGREPLKRIVLLERKIVKWGSKGTSVVEDGQD